MVFAQTHRQDRGVREANRLSTCASCRRPFAVCGPCDRGRRHCSPSCARTRRQGQLRVAGRRYQATERGRLAHALRQALYRARRAGVTHPPAEALAVLPAISVRGPRPPARSLPDLTGPHPAPRRAPLGNLRRRRQPARTAASRRAFFEMALLFDDAVTSHVRDRLTMRLPSSGSVASAAGATRAFHR
jgi:hypothetical protein